MNLQILFAFFIYFGILLIIGLVSHKKSKSETDFIMGNRSLNYWVTALSAHASDMSAWLFMAFPAAIYIGGVPQAWTAFGLVGGMFLNWQFVAKSLDLKTKMEVPETKQESSFFMFVGGIGILSSIISIITALLAVIKSKREKKASENLSDK